MPETAQENIETKEKAKEEIKEKAKEDTKKEIDPHEEALQAIDLLQSEEDEEKRAELYEKARESLAKARDLSRSEKKSYEERLNEALKKQEKKAPEKYDLKLKEGSRLEPGFVEKISLFAKEKGFSQNEAQELLDLHQSAIEEYEERQKETLHRLSLEWAEEAKKDKEIGGKNFSRSAELAKRVVQKFGSERLKEGLNQTGFGNHPELVKFLAKIGEAMADDLFVFPSQAPSGKKAPEDILYGERKE